MTKEEFKEKLASKLREEVYAEALGNKEIDKDKIEEFINKLSGAMADFVVEDFLPNVKIKVKGRVEGVVLGTDSVEIELEGKIEFEQ
jgi:predicted house-cleaning noncanonical NTP pyrophosphatase (MazG superfamily)